MARTIQAGTVVRFDLNYSAPSGTGLLDYFDVEFFDAEAPVTVANFIRYVNNGMYDGTIVHRSVDSTDEYGNAVPFVIQGGGYAPRYEGGYVSAMSPITTYSPIKNEFSPARSNVAGTIAMAKLGDDPDSATSQWFVNLSDNSANLDNQNGGFTVFGKVIGAGMTVVNGINGLQTEDLSSYFGGAFTDVPMFDDGYNFVTVTGASVVSKPAGKLSGYVYVDMNQNGIMDGDDYAVADAKVTITMSGRSTPAATVQTAADGSYTFANLASGTYSVKMETPTTAAGQDNGAAQMVLDKDGNILNVGTAGAAQKNAYNGIWLGDAQSGVNFNFAQKEYPVALVSLRMFIDPNHEFLKTDPVAVPATNVADGSVLGFGNVLVGATAKSNLTVANVGSQGSALSGEFPAGDGEFGPADASAFGPLDSTQDAGREYTFTPAVRGASSKDLYIATNVGNLKVALSGTGVAPVSSVLAANAYALVGKEGTASVNVQNVGDGNLSGSGDESNLIGSIPDSSGDFTGQGGGVSLADGASQTFEFAFTPTVRGEVKSTTISASFSNGSQDGKNNPHALDVTVTGTGVAPVRSVDDAGADAGLVRIGAAGSASFTVANVGDGNLSGLGDESNLVGVAAAGSGNFSGDGGSLSLPDNAERTFNYTYTPTARAADATTIALEFGNGNANGSNLAETVYVDLIGQGVGPVFSSDLDPGSSLDFGLVPQAETKSLILKISNATTDPNGGDATLTGLTIISAEISGTDAELFSLSGFTPGVVLHEGESLGLEIAYNGTGEHGDRSAVLAIVTDEGAIFGIAGNGFAYQINVSLAPEPGSLALLTIAGLALGGLAWRRRR